MKERGVYPEGGNQLETLGAGLERQNEDGAQRAGKAAWLQEQRGAEQGGAQHRNAVLLQGPSEIGVVCSCLYFLSCFSPLKTYSAECTWCHPSSQMAF